MTRKLTAIVFGLLLLGEGFGAPVPKLKAKVTPMPTAVGTKWTYQVNDDETMVNTEEITEAVEKDGVWSITVAITMAGQDEKSIEKFEINKDGDLLLTETGAGKYRKPFLVWKAGVKDGESWESNYIDPEGNEYSLKCTLGKAEELTTPAGKYMANPVTREYTKPEQITISTYYHNDVVGLVREVQDDVKRQELKSYKEGKAEKPKDKETEKKDK